MRASPFNRHQHHGMSASPFNRHQHHGMSASPFRMQDGYVPCGYIDKAASRFGVQTCFSDISFVLNFGLKSFLKRRNDGI
jgi:hypothetical protein